MKKETDAIGGGERGWSGAWREEVHGLYLPQLQTGVVVCNVFISRNCPIGRTVTTCRSHWSNSFLKHLSLFESRTICFTKCYLLAS